MPNTLAGRYRLEERIAVGGMGSVWRAHDEVLRRPVAVKLLNESLAHDPTATERFRREALTAASLSHPHMANVFDYIEEDGTPGIVMELVESETLTQRLARERPLSVPEATRIIDAVLDAVAAAHREGVIHRDIKPGNILLTPKGNVKVTDFGIARSLGDSTLTATGNVMGTAHYSAPEQVGGEATSPATDVYSTGVVLYEMLTGARPFSGDSQVAVALARLSEDPPDPRELRPDLPAGIVAVLARALARDPAVRFADAGAMRAALAGLGPAAGDDGTAVLVTGHADATVAMAAAPAAPQRARLSPAARRRMGLGLGAVVVLALVGVMIAAAMSGGRRAAPEPSPSPSAAATVPPCCIVPDLTGMTVEDAEIALAQAELGLGKTTKAVSSSPEGTVIFQSISPGDRLDEGDTVNVVVAEAPPRAEPDPEPEPEREQRGKGKGRKDDD